MLQNVPLMMKQLTVQAISQYMASVPADQKQFYYFANDAVLTFITGKSAKKTSFDASVTAIYFTAGGSVYSSNTVSKKQRIVSLDLISLRNR